MQTTANEAVTLRSAALPDLVCTALTFIATDPYCGAPTWTSMAQPHYPSRARMAGFRPNAKIVPASPSSPNSVCTVTALQPISADELILATFLDQAPSETVIQIVGQIR